MIFTLPCSKSSETFLHCHLFHFFMTAQRSAADRGLNGTELGSHHDRAGRRNGVGEDACARENMPKSCHFVPRLLSIVVSPRCNWQLQLHHETVGWNNAWHTKLPEGGVLEGQNVETQKPHDPGYAVSPGWSKGPQPLSPCSLRPFAAPCFPIPRRIASSKRLFASASRCEKPCPVMQATCISIFPIICYVRKMHPGIYRHGTSPILARGCRSCRCFGGADTMCAKGWVILGWNVRLRGSGMRDEGG